MSISQKEKLINTDYFSPLFTSMVLFAEECSCVREISERIMTPFLAWDLYIDPYLDSALCIIIQLALFIGNNNRSHIYKWHSYVEKEATRLFQDSFKTHYCTTCLLHYQVMSGTFHLM